VGSAAVAADEQVMESAVPRPGEAARRIARLIPLEQFRALTLVGVLAVIWIVFQLLTNGLFLSPRNLTTLTIQVAVTAILAAGIVVIMVPGHIDLSIGSAVAFCGMFASLLVDPARGLGWPLSPSVLILLTLMLGLLIGMWQGFWVAWMRVPAFIVTLASLLALRGAALTITGGSTASPEDKLTFLAAEFLPAWVGMLLLAGLVAGFLGLRVLDWRARLAAGIEASLLNTVVVPVALLGVLAGGAVAVAFSYRGAPLPVVILGGEIAAITFFMNRTRFGRHLYAIGGNPDAARYAGINAKLHSFGVFAAMGLFYGLAGMLLVSRIGVAVPTAGTGLELTVIASAVIGGTSLFGGVGTATGAVIGALLLESLNNGMGLMNVESSFQMIVNGLVLLVAVYFDLRGRRAQRE